jgi:hypothetical protein
MTQWRRIDEGGGGTLERHAFRHLTTISKTENGKLEVFGSCVIEPSDTGKAMHAHGQRIGKFD